MFKTVLTAFAAAAVLMAPNALAQERTILTSAPTADEFAGYLFPSAPEGVKLRGLPTRGIQFAAPQSAAQPAAPAHAPAILAAPVNFALDSASIPTEFAPYLVNLAEAMKRPEAAGKVVLVSGHTDSLGGEMYNLGLSNRRANAVEEFLVSRGVPVTQIVAVGKGESDPLPGRSENDGLNRRVEFRIIE